MNSKSVLRLSALIVLISCTSLIAYSQVGFSLSTSQFNGSNSGGHNYNISCNGASTGWILAAPASSGVSYTYLWSNGLTTSTITGLMAGTYSVLVTDPTSSATATTTVQLYEPDPLSVSITPVTTSCGFNISHYGASDGKINPTVSGGANSYAYSWTNSGSTVSTVAGQITGLAAGTYTLTVTDPNGCSSSASATLTQPDLLQITNISKSTSTHGSYNVNCSNGNDGWISVTVAGGSQPYHYSWNTGATTSAISNLLPGTYTLSMWDCAGGDIETSIALTAPNPIQITFTPSHYSNGFNINTYGNNDGSLTANVTGGVGTNSYTWLDAQNNLVESTNNTASGLWPEPYTVTVTDANSCTASATKWLFQPPAPSSYDGGWGMAGNANSDPSYDFIGTTDNTDFVMRTNNTEEMRMAANGNLGIGTTSPSEKLDITGNERVSGHVQIGGLGGFGNAGLYADNAGVLHVIPYPFQAFGMPCSKPSTWFEGVSNPSDITRCDGNVGIGTGSPAADLDIRRDLDAQVQLWGGSLHQATYWAVNAEYAYGFGIDNNGHGNIYQNINNPVALMTFSNGIVGIGLDPSAVNITGTDPHPYKLLVGGKIGAEDIYVTDGSAWPDYVFSKDYQLKSLGELEQFINKNKHLPGYPSVNEVKVTGGVSVSEVQKETVKKIEELTLYMIQLNKELDDLKKENEELKCSLNKK